MSLSAADAKRNALVLSAAQAIIGSANPVALSVGGLVGYGLLGQDKSLATAPVTSPAPQAECKEAARSSSKRTIARADMARNASPSG